MCRAGCCSRPDRDAGFTLIEVLVAIAVLAVSLAAIGSIVSVTMRGSRSLYPDLVLVETARAVMATLPDADRLSANRSFTGDAAGYRWRMDVARYVETDAAARQGGPLAGTALRWVPLAVAVTVQSPSGRSFRTTTVRLGRADPP